MANTYDQHIGKTVVITLVRSTICTTPKHRAFVATLGLKKIGNTRECVFTPGVAGMVKLIPHLLHLQVKG